MIGLNLRFAVSEHVELDIRGGAQLTPFRAKPVVDRELYNAACPVPFPEPNRPECALVNFTYPAEPLYMLRAGIGLRVNL